LYLQIKKKKNAMSVWKRKRVVVVRIYVARNWCNTREKKALEPQVSCMNQARTIVESWQNIQWDNDAITVSDKKIAFFDGLCGEKLV